MLKTAPPSQPFLKPWSNVHVHCFHFQSMYSASALYITVPVSPSVAVLSFMFHQLHVGVPKYSNLKVKQITMPLEEISRHSLSFCQFPFKQAFGKVPALVFVFSLSLSQANQRSHLNSVGLHISFHNPKGIHIRLIICMRWL